MSAAEVPRLIKRLLDEVTGRVYVWNVIDQIEVRQLALEDFERAWTYFVDNSSSTTSTAQDVILQIGKWPGGTTSITAHNGAWLRGRQRPATLHDWRRRRRTVSVTRTHFLSARLHASAVVAGTPHPPAVARGVLPFMMWSTSMRSLPNSADADDARDRLGLVHCDPGDDLTLIEFGPGQLGHLYRPTPLDSGANSRFYGVPEMEWAVRSSSSPKPCMGRAADLSRVRANTPPFGNAMEAVSLASAKLVSKRKSDRWLGLVKRSTSLDVAADPNFEAQVARGRVRSTQEAFLHDAYRT
jgi:hypothetical protein